LDLLFDKIREETANQFSYSHINLIQDTTKKEVIDQINVFIDGFAGPAEHNEIVEGSGWPSWYPIIDYSRCTSCGQCSDFCLFGVYEKAEKRIVVSNPKGCKNYCPACARICPATAIIFPKYVNGGAIGGSDEIDELAEQQRQALDMEHLLGNDLYSALERRKVKRNSIIREDAMNKAISERDNALKGLETK
jgi:NAD-dependent dihydropyrimidine dehydrogenase PreA subunit